LTKVIQERDTWVYFRFIGIQDHRHGDAV